jgi:hypothetical protein
VPGRDLDGDRIAGKLVKGEPAHDLDLGSLVLVSRDRALRNHLTVSALVVVDDGLVNEQKGSHDGRLCQRPAEPAPREQSRELSFKECQELDDVPGRMEPLEIAGASKRLGNLKRGLAAGHARRVALAGRAG